MNTIETRRYEMLVRVRDFGAVHADLFLESSLAQQTFTAVAEAVQHLTLHTVCKLSSVQGGTTKAIARASLQDQLEAISQTARVIAKHTPDVREKFVLPDIRSDQALLMTARVFAREARPLEEQFVAHAMPKTFLADLQAGIAQFEQAIHEREAGRDERIAARARIKAALTSGLAAVRALDVIVANRLRDDPATMAVWKRARRVQYPSRARTAVHTRSGDPALSNPKPQIPNPKSQPGRDLVMAEAASGGSALAPDQVTSSVEVSS